MSSNIRGLFFAADERGQTRIRKRRFEMSDPRCPRHPRLILFEAIVRGFLGDDDVVNV